MSEHTEQAAFVAQVLYCYRNDPTFIRGLFFSTFNGAWLGGSAKARGYQMFKAKAAGFLPGVADILYLQARAKYHYLTIEMKDKKGRLSQDQVDFIFNVRRAGGYAFVSYGVDDAILTFEAYMKLEPA